jgi:Ni/Co efflux regulator RcnB
MTKQYRGWRTVFALVAGLTAAGGLTPSSAHAQGYGQREPQREEHRRFDDHDRQVAREWYDGHHGAVPVGLRDRDHFAADVELRFNTGFVIDHDLRAQVHPIPSDLAHRLTPPPHGFRYVLIGGHLCLIDGRYEVQDVIHLGHGR